jgi:octaprenyl-diphosphate synthase
VGKPTGNDIKEKKLTLPLIYTLNNIDKPTRRQIIYIIKNQNKNPEKIKFVINKVTEAGGIEYAVQKMNEYKNEAMKILFEFPQGEIRNGLAELVNFVTDRKY